MLSYQPLWIDGKTVGESARDAAGRYEMIRTCLKAVVRPGFTMLDVGAQSGYFSVRFAQEMGAKAVAIDGDPALVQGMKEMDFTNVSAVTGFLKPGDLKVFLGRDVGLCLSVLHHVDWWETMLEELLDCCQILFIECAMPGEDIGKPELLLHEQLGAVSSLPEAMLVGTTPGFDARFRRPMYMIPGRA